jgi:hypothetical protein
MVKTGLDVDTTSLSEDERGSWPALKMFLYVALMVVVFWLADGVPLVQANALLLGVIGSISWIWFLRANRVSDRLNNNQKALKSFRSVELYDDANCRTVAVLLLMTFVALALVCLSMFPVLGGHIRVEIAAPWQWLVIAGMYLAATRFISNLSTQTSLYDAFVSFFNIATKP